MLTPKGWQRGKLLRLKIGKSEYNRISLHKTSRGYLMNPLKGIWPKLGNLKEELS